MSAPIAIIAGQGDLPVHLSRSLIASGREVILAELDAFPADNPDGLPLIPFRVEKLGALFKALRKAGVEELVFAGSIRRPRIDPKKFDLKTVTLAPKFMAAIKGGDDGTLRAVLAIFEGEGFAVRAAHEVMPSLLPAAGIPTQAQPSERDRKDTARAARIVRAMAAADVGQGAVVAQGLALALEAVPGTDVMLDHVAEVAGRWRREGAEGKGVLFKGPKAGQDRRIDLPVIGPSTMRGAAKAGLSGVAIEARGVMVLDLAEVIRISDAEGLFLWIREPEQGA